MFIDGHHLSMFVPQHRKHMVCPPATSPFTSAAHMVGARPLDLCAQSFSYTVWLIASTTTSLSFRVNTVFFLENYDIGCCRREGLDFFAIVKSTQNNWRRWRWGSGSGRSWLSALIVHRSAYNAFWPFSLQFPCLPAIHSDVEMIWENGGENGIMIL